MVHVRLRSHDLLSTAASELPRDCYSPHLDSGNVRGSGSAIEVVSGLVDMEEGAGPTAESVANAFAIGGASGRICCFCK
jgi:hypothetical protein